MIFSGLNKYDGADPDSQDLVHYWHPQMTWHGPRGAGSSLDLDEFRQLAQAPFLRMTPNRKGVGHRARIAEGHFAASTGWPASVGTMAGDFLGWPASGREMTLTSWTSGAAKATCCVRTGCSSTWSTPQPRLTSTSGSGRGCDERHRMPGPAIYRI